MLGFQPISQEALSDIDADYLDGIASALPTILADPQTRRVFLVEIYPYQPAAT